jgi:hypothetical protein
MPAAKAAPTLLLLAALLALALTALAPAEARAESAAAARLRALAEESAANQNATDAEKAATRGLFSSLSSDGANSVATGKAALALSEIALGQGKADSAKSLAEAVLDMVAGNKTGTWGVLANRAKTLLGAAASVQQAYAAGSAAVTDGALLFVDAEMFDRKLSDTLAAKPAKAEVQFPVAVGMKKLPERLDKWFSAVEKSGGKVETVAVTETGRGILGDLIELAFKLYDLLTARDLYAPAQYYNATVYYRRSSGEVVRVVFSLRETAK